MSKKSLIYGGMFVGGTLGGFIPLLWGASAFGFQGIIFNAIGGGLGIWVAFKLSQGF